MVTLEDVRVPKRFLIGEENCGFLYILENFNHERWVIAAGSCRSSRECYREAFEWASKVYFFGTIFKDALFFIIFFFLIREKLLARNSSNSPSFAPNCRKCVVSLKPSTIILSGKLISC
jgi:hypothetical protein